MEIRLGDYQYYIRPRYTGKGAQSLALAISPENPFKPRLLLLQSGLWRDLSCPSLESYEERCERYLESAGLDGLSLEELRKVSRLLLPDSPFYPGLMVNGGKYITARFLNEAVLSGALDVVSGLGEFSTHEAKLLFSFHSPSGRRALYLTSIPSSLSETP